MSRIAAVTQRALQKGSKLLIPYLVAGDPNLETTKKLMHSLVDCGADIIELGIPFSDPSSDGPVIQRGVERSLAQGTSLADTLQIVNEFRQQDQVTPIVLMGYLNPIETMGYEAFTQRAVDVDVDGVLVVDMPPAESTTLHQMLRNASIDTIYLVAPTTHPDRAVTIAQHSTGYLYYVSLKGVTGAALTDHASVQKNIEALRKLTDLPIVIGFGIKDGDSARAMAQQSDGVVIGSALVARIGELTGLDAISLEQITATTDIIKEVRQAVNSAS
ncbi:MAG: tryptophan synthase subunit alpha [Pseudomonadales bacterium]|nr:tryptophan synthase subunit alpha [Pseudomonadales bacterium]